LSYVVILSPSLVMLSGAKHLSSSAQSKLREESMLLILKQCEMLRAVYPEREMKGILPPIHCIGVRMTSEWARHDSGAILHRPSKMPSDTWATIFRRFLWTDPFKTRRC